MFVTFAAEGHLVPMDARERRTACLVATVGATRGGGRHDGRHDGTLSGNIGQLVSPGPCMLFASSVCLAFPTESRQRLQLATSMGLYRGVVQAARVALESSSPGHEEARCKARELRYVLEFDWLDWLFVLSSFYAEQGFCTPEYDLSARSTT